MPGQAFMHLKPEPNSLRKVGEQVVSEVSREISNSNFQTYIRPLCNTTVNNLCGGKCCAGHVAPWPRTQNFCSCFGSLPAHAGEGTVPQREKVRHGAKRLIIQMPKTLYSWEEMMPIPKLDLSALFGTHDF